MTSKHQHHERCPLNDSNPKSGYSSEEHKCGMSNIKCLIPLTLITIAVVGFIFGLFTGNGGEHAEGTDSLVDSKNICSSITEISISNNNNNLGIHLLGKLSTSGKNLVLSPFSLTSALNLAYLGSSGRTGYQIRDFLKLPCKVAEEYMENFKLISESLTMSDVSDDSNSLKIVTASKIYIAEHKITLSPFYIQLSQKYQKTDPTLVNFEDTEAARKTINSWIENQTHGKISDIYPKNSPPSASTVMVILSAVYFKARWAKPFVNAGQKKFYSSGFGDKNGKTCDSMTVEGSFKIVNATTQPSEKLASLKVDILEIPYWSGQGDDDEIKSSMVILVPRAGYTLTDIMEEFHDNLGMMKEIDDFLATHSYSKAHIQMPKFKFESSLDLKPVLINAGVGDMFHPKLANFSGMFQNKSQGKGGHLVVDTFVQKVVIDVDEEGTEAAAVTEVISALTSGTGPTENFVVDKPFLFFVRATNINGKDPKNLILFEGIVEDPTIGGD